MESLSILPVTIASILSSYSGSNLPVEEAVISTHISPEISGLWEIDLQDSGNNSVNNETLTQANKQSDTEYQNSGEKLGESKVNTDALTNNSTTTTEQRSKDESQLNDMLSAIQDSNLKTDDGKPFNTEVQKVYSEKSVEQNSTPALNTASKNLNSSNNKCHERYNLGADNKVVTTSGKEWTYGEYIYHHTEDGLPILAISTIYDNNEMDCSGNQVDQTGEAIIAFVDYQSDKNEMRWCADKEGKVCFMTFHRLLP